MAKKKKSGGVHTHVKGYLRIHTGPQKWKYVHILVAEAMLRGPVPEGFEVNHIDTDRQNPAWTNLEIIPLEKNRPGCNGGPHGHQALAARRALFGQEALDYV